MAISLYFISHDGMERKCFTIVRTGGAGPLWLRALERRASDGEFGWIWFSPDCLRAPSSGSWAELRVVFLSFGGNRRSVESLRLCKNSGRLWCREGDLGGSRGAGVVLRRVGGVVFVKG